MEHFIRIAFWIAFFCLTKPVSSHPIEGEGWSRRIRLMQNDVKCENDAMFYAPENVKSECITAALQCIEKELNGTVRVECEDSRNRTDMALEALHKLIEKLPKTTLAATDSTECACEKWPQRIYSVFVNKTKNVIEQAISSLT